MAASSYALCAYTGSRGAHEPPRLGGTSYALTLGKNSVGAEQIKKNAVGASEIRKGAVRSGEVSDGSLLAGDFSPGQLPAGATGATGAKGDKGDKGDQGDTGSPGLSGVEIVNVSGSQNSTQDTKFNGVSCPAGKKVIAGGGSITDNSGSFGTEITGSPRAVLTESRPNGTTGWWASGVERVDQIWGIKVFAVCAVVEPAP